MTLTLRKITDIKDMVVIQDIYKETFKDIYEIYKDDETNPYCESIESLEEKFSQENMDYLFIESDDEIIGMARVIVEGVTARIAPIAVFSRSQGGTGTKAMALIEETYPEITTWILETIKQEAKLVHFYQKLGFVLTGKVEHIQNGMDIVYFEKLKK